MSEELPQGWAYVELKELCTSFDYGSSAKSQPTGRVPVLRMGNIQNGKIDWTDLVFTSDHEEIKKYSLKPNTVLFNRTNSPELVGKTAIFRGERPAIFAGYLIRANPLPVLDPEYLNYCLNTNYAREYCGRVKTDGVSQSNINAQKLAAFEVPFCSLREQKRIVAKLELLLDKVDACRKRLEKIPVIMKRFRQSVLAAACSGRLTEDWREGNPSEEWESVRLDDVCASISDGDHQAPPQTDSGIPFITIAAINDGRLRLEKAKRHVTSLYYKGLKAERRPRRGDVLYSVTGSIGIPALVDIDDAFTFQRHIAILRPDDSRILGTYLHHTLGTDSVREQALAVATGIAQMTIPLGGLRNFVIDLPPLPEQHEIVSRVEALFALADQIETRYAKAKTHVDRLTQSILAKAFRGDLVPQDPKDEPAAVLLERIREGREGAEVVRKKRGCRSPTATVTTC